MATLPQGITQEELDRYALLDRGVKKLQDERKLLGDHIKQAFAKANITGKRTLIFPSEKFGSVVLKLGEQNRISPEAKAEIAEAFPQAEFPEYWKCEPDIDAIPEIKVDPFRKTIMTLSVDVERDDPDVSPKHVART